MAYYVNMHDKFMSGWGDASRGRALYCIECETYAQAVAIEKAAQDRPEMKRVAISDKPRQMRPGDQRSIRRFEDLGGPWLRYWAGD